MRILCVTSSYPSAMNPIAGNFVKSHVESLRAQGHTVDIIAANMFSARTIFKWIKFKISVNNSPEPGCFSSSNIINLWPFGPWFHKYWFSKTINSDINKYIAVNGVPEIVHAHFILWAGFAAAKNKLLKNIPLVVTEHSSLYFENKVTLVEMILTGETLKHASAVICPSEFMKKSLINNVSGYESKFSLIPNIADSIFFEKYDFSQKENFIVSVGRMVKDKGFDVLIRAFSKLKNATDYKLVLVGEGDELTSLKLLTAELGLSQKVEFTGTISKMELAALVRRSKILASCSYFETFGVTIAEALATGTPVLVTNVGAPAGFVIPGTGEICKVKDVADTTLKLDKMISGYSNYHLGNIQSYALRNFNASSVATLTTLLYKKVLRIK